MRRLFASIFATSLLVMMAGCHSSNHSELTPDVLGLTVADATAKLQHFGLSLGTQTTASSATVPVGEIISQSPSAGIGVSGGSAVNVVVSSGPPTAAPGIAPPSLFGATVSGPGPATVTAAQTDIAASAVHALAGQSGNASSPSAGLTVGADGNFYGVSAHGGANQDKGSFFRITPGGARVILYSFGTRSGDPISPDAPLILAADGSFYGTSSAGGAYGDGAVYRLTPSGVETVLYSFSGGTGSDPANPSGGLIQGADGNFYGTTRTGGIHGTGVLFRLTPAGSLSILGSLATGRTSEAGDVSGETAR